MPRKTKRLPVSLAISLESSSGRREARISDLSMEGCFIDSILEAAKGEIIKFALFLPGDEPVNLSGRIVYVMPRIGFGVRFVELTEEKKIILEHIILTLGGDPYSKGD
jgi:hypothetical protein